MLYISYQRNPYVENSTNCQTMCHIVLSKYLSVCQLFLEAKAERSETITTRIEWVRESEPGKNVQNLIYCLARKLLLMRFCRFSFGYDVFGGSCFAYRKTLCNTFSKYFFSGFISRSLPLSRCFSIFLHFMAFKWLFQEFFGYAIITWRWSVLYNIVWCIQEIRRMLFCCTSPP